MNEIRKQIEESIRIKQSLMGNDEIIKAIEDAAEICIKAIKRGNKIMLAGNGGSAADAQHFAGELVCRFRFDRLPLPAIALTTDTSVLTSVSNDYSFEVSFSRQVNALGKESDILILISTSGNSPNILKAADEARNKKITVIGLTGETGGKLKYSCDIAIRVPSDDTPRIQECHILIIHILCGLIENGLFAKNKNNSF